MNTDDADRPLLIVIELMSLIGMLIAAVGALLSIAWLP